MNKLIEFMEEHEVEITASITPFMRGKGPSMDHAGGSPDEPCEVEDLYVGVIIRGRSIDITELLDKKQRAYFEEKCLVNALDDELEDHS